MKSLQLVAAPVARAPPLAPTRRGVDVGGNGGRKEVLAGFYRCQRGR